MEVSVVPISDSCNSFVHGFFDAKNNRLNDFFIRFKQSDSLLGFETNIPYSSLDSFSDIKICSDDGTICTKWFKVKLNDCYKFIANIDFEVKPYFWDVDKYYFKKNKP